MNFAAAAAFGLALLAAPQARAGQMDKITVVTIDQPVEIPGVVLGAGTYEFKIAGADMPDVVQIFDRDGRQLVATLMAIPVYRSTPSDDSTIKVGERSAGSPPAIEQWFRPGENYGLEFLYPKPGPLVER